MAVISAWLFHPEKNPVGSVWWFPHSHASHNGRSTTTSCFEHGCFKPPSSSSSSLPSPSPIEKVPASPVDFSSQINCSQETYSRLTSPAAFEWHPTLPLSHCLRTTAYHGGKKSIRTFHIGVSKAPIPTDMDCLLHAFSALDHLDLCPQSSQADG